MDNPVGGMELWRLNKAPYSKTGEMDYVRATGIGRPSNLNPDRSWMLQHISLPKWMASPLCQHCEGLEDMPRHVLFECRR